MSIVLTWSNRVDICMWYLSIHVASKVNQNLNNYKAEGVGRVPYRNTGDTIKPYSLINSSHMQPVEYNKNLQYRQFLTLYARTKFLGQENQVQTKKFLIRMFQEEQSDQGLFACIFSKLFIDNKIGLFSHTRSGFPLILPFNLTYLYKPVG